MERRIVLLGKTGSGRSASGNTILKGKYFKEKSSPETVTTKCEMKTSGHITVIDTSGMFDTLQITHKLRAVMNTCIQLSDPGPHVFLLVIKLGRFTDEEKNAVTWIKKIFGNEALRYTMVLFTHTDQLGQRTLDEFLSESRDLRQLLMACGNRYHGFNNNDCSPAQVESLMHKINQIIRKNDGLFYNNEMYQKAQDDEMLPYVATAAITALVGIALLSLFIKE